MANTCMGNDNTAPCEIQEALRTYIGVQRALLRHRLGGERRFAERALLDAPGCCLVEDLGGKRCDIPNGICCYTKEPYGEPLGKGYEPKKPIERPLDLVPRSGKRRRRRSR